MLQTDRIPGVNRRAGVQPNADGSFGIYLGTKAPAGKERNWIQ